MNTRKALNPCVRLLCNAYWQLEREMQLIVEEDTVDSALIRLRSPLRLPHRDLRIDAAGDEVTIATAHWHTHLDFDVNDPDFVFHCVELVRLLDDLIHERTLVLDFYRNRSWAGSQTISLPATDRIPASTREEIRQCVATCNADAYRLWSWSGGFDEVQGDIGD